jgi:carboxylesterase type B
MIITKKNRTIHEVFAIITEQKTKKEKIDALRTYDNRVIRWYVDCLYNRDWSDMQVPSVKLSHRPYGICSTNLAKSISRIEQAYFYRLTKPEVTEKMLTIVLSEISEPEAKLLLNMFNGKKIEGIHKSIFKEVYPEFFRTAATSETDSGDSEKVS